MNLKDTTILLIFLLCVLGLIVGVCLTEDSDDAVSLNSEENAVHEDINETVTINLEIEEKNESSLNKSST